MDQHCSLQNTRLQLQKASVWAKYCLGLFNFWGLLVLGRVLKADTNFEFV